MHELMFILLQKFLQMFILDQMQFCRGDEDFYKIIRYCNTTTFEYNRYTSKITSLAYGRSRGVPPPLFPLGVLLICLLQSNQCPDSCRSQYCILYVYQGCKHQIIIIIIIIYGAPPPWKIFRLRPRGGLHFNRSLSDFKYLHRVQYIFFNLQGNKICQNMLNAACIQYEIQLSKIFKIFSLFLGNIL
eukprot:TRINITY_DN9046_c0_g1_i3.p2 TRINITY_DN9046_c0_g1~~TRINITY_DN9046_c0_g1_i3.p2  ORF type:complete len:187 (-),score=-12.10 TRINITY_DN9046_c0_g1_i3:229-789(-)